MVADMDRLQLLKNGTLSKDGKPSLSKSQSMHSLSKAQGLWKKSLMTRAQSSESLDEKANKDTNKALTKTQQESQDKLIAKVRELKATKNKENAAPYACQMQGPLFRVGPCN